MGGNPVHTASSVFCSACHVTEEAYTDPRSQQQAYVGGGRFDVCINTGMKHRGGSAGLFSNEPQHLERPDRGRDQGEQETRAKDVTAVLCGDIGQTCTESSRSGLSSTQQP